MKHTAYLFSIITLVVTGLATAGETITLNGQTIRNCEIVELTRDGVVYQSGDTDDLHVVPWAQLTAVQQDVLRKQHNKALVNAICDARYVKGSVFEANKDGVIVQIDIPESDDEKGIEGYRNGAKVLKGGSILVSDLPTDVPRGSGAPIELILYYKEKYDFTLGPLGSTEVEHLTYSLPEWFQETDWKNAAGATMKARLLGVKGDKALFLKGGQRMLLNLSQLDAASQTKAKEIQAKLAGYPVP